MDTLQRIFGLCKTIYERAENAKANKDRCQRVAQRVQALERLVKAIEEKGPGQISSAVQQSLNELCVTLVSAEQLMRKFYKSNAIEGFVKSSSNEDKFSKINDKLNDNFQVLSGALQIEQRDMLISLCSSKRSVNEGNGPAQTSPLPFPMPEPWHATSVFSPVAQPHHTVPMSPQSPPFSPTAPCPLQTPQFRSPAPLPPQTQQFRPPAPLPPQTQQFRPPARLPPQTQQFRPPAPLPSQTQQFRPPAPLPPQTQQFRPPAPLPPQTQQFRPPAPLPPQTQQFRPPAPLPPQTQQFRPPAPLPPQTQQFRPPAPLPPQTQQFRPPAPLPPQTPQCRPPAPLPPQTPQFRPPAPFIPTTPTVPPTIQRSNPTTAVPAPRILSPMSGPISTVPHHFPASVPAHLLNPGNVASMSGPAVMNITIQSTTVVTHYSGNNPGFQ
ncbi:vegetative cell wall protein gp1-like [Xiphophorus couchianus]|uniref:vegetative cell wall protein gp1-like n=1 Tax=Xiphophorus couchianus TaxID=32473 RepID=UPI0010160FFC|nr:vegetative cell wall protein gp1-like [Xiphophorus couchianus]XP_027898283.1 vegetative cell wall protein gp1-like [Xiphophorus couchianus]